MNKCIAFRPINLREHVGLEYVVGEHWPVNQPARLSDGAMYDEDQQCCSDSFYDLWELCCLKLQLCCVQCCCPESSLMDTLLAIASIRNARTAIQRQPLEHTPPPNKNTPFQVSCV